MALSLTRKVEESFKLLTSSEEIEITLRRIKGRQAVISITAPKNVKVLRSELEEQQQSKKEWE